MWQRREACKWAQWEVVRLSKTWNWREGKKGSQLSRRQKKQGGKKAGNILVCSHYPVTRRTQSGTSWHEESGPTRICVVCVCMCVVDDFVIVKQANVALGQILNQGLHQNIAAGWSHVTISVSNSSVALRVAMNLPHACTVTAQGTFCSCCCIASMFHLWFCVCIPLLTRGCLMKPCPAVFMHLCGASSPCRWRQPFVFVWPREEWAMPDTGSSRKRVWMMWGMKSKQQKMKTFLFCFILVRITSWIYYLLFRLQKLLCLCNHLFLLLCYMRANDKSFSF